MFQKNALKTVFLGGDQLTCERIRTLLTDAMWCRIQKRLAIMPEFFVCGFGGTHLGIWHLAVGSQLSTSATKISSLDCSITSF